MTVAILLRRAQAKPGQLDEAQVLGPCERGALAIGLDLARAFATDAIAIAAGPARREDRVLAMALRAGCARALRVWGDGADDLDFLGSAEILAAAIKGADADHVVCGDRSVDERTGAIGPAIAELLGVAHLSGVIAVRVEGGAVGHVAIEAEHVGERQRLTVRLRGPVVLCAAALPVRGRDPEVSAANAATGAAAAAAGGSQSIVTQDLEELGLDLRRLAPRRALAGRLRPMRGTRQATLLPDAAALVARLRDAHLLGEVDGAGRARARPTAPPHDGDPAPGDDP